MLEHYSQDVTLSLPELNNTIYSIIYNTVPFQPHQQNLGGYIVLW
jgi:hypothetical protein